VTDAEAESEGDGGQKMRGVEQADIELVADIGPRHFPHKVDFEPLLCGKSLVDRDDEGGGVNQRDETDLQRSAHFNISEAVRIDCAISPIFFFSRIAVERSST